MEKEKVVRCSDLPRVMRCPASLGTEAKWQTDAPEARLGTAVHLLLERFIKDGGIDKLPDSEVAAFARAEGVSVNDAAFLYHTGTAWWKERCGQLVDTCTEVAIKKEINGVVLSGHIDVLARDSNGDIIVIDWKTGNGDSEQLRGYAELAASHLNDEFSNVHCCIVRLREIDDVQTETYTPADRKAWRERFERTLCTDRLPYFCPGKACTYCRNHDCDAYREYSADAMNVLSVLFGSNAEKLCPEFLGAMREKVQLISRAVSKYDELWKRAIADMSAIPDGKGGEYVRKASFVSAIKLSSELYDIMGAEAWNNLLNNSTVSKGDFTKACIKAKIKPQIREEMLTKALESGLITATKRFTTVYRECEV